MCCFLSYYLQHFADTFRQSVIDLLLGNLEDVSEISADDPIEQFGKIVQTCLVPDCRPPEYFNYGVLGHDLKIVNDTVFFARFTAANAMTCILLKLFVFLAATTWRGSRTRTDRQRLT